MRELRITFAKANDGGDLYTVRLTDASGKLLGKEVSFTPFLGEDDYEDLRWYLEDYMELPDGGAITRAQRIESQLDRWGRRLHDALFSDEKNAVLLEQLREAPEPRELTVATDDAVLLRLPWELMTDSAGALAQRVSIRRQLPEAGGVSAILRAAALPLRLLYIVSRPDDTGFIDPRLTSQAMLTALDPLGASVRADFCRPPTLARLEEMLRDAQHEGAPYHLAHFDGHGTFLSEVQLGALCFEKPDDGMGKSETDLVRADRLGTILAGFKIPLVVLEACRSGTVKTLVFRSVAPRLIQAGVGSVLSMGHAVHVEAARVLLDRFYRELVNGTSIGHAVAVARKSLVTSNERWIQLGPGGRKVALHDWFLPHLYQRGDDHSMLPVPAANEKQGVRQFDLFLSHNHADSARVEALARTLSDTHGLRVWLDKWECGPGPLEPQCSRGIRDSRFTVVIGSKKSIASPWVRWEIDRHAKKDPEGSRLLPVKFEPVELPSDLQPLLWEDFTDPKKDAESASRLARLIRSRDAEDARRKRGFRAPAGKGEPGEFPPPPQFGFRGRARELHLLERRLRRTRGIVLHAMGGMGKTALAGEAARWWTRSGLFRDGACFISFERPQSAESVVRTLGSYLNGPNFEQLPASEQRRRAVEDFQKQAVLLVWDNFESTLPQFAGDEDEKGDEAESPYDDEGRRELADLFRELTSREGLGRLLVTCRPGETFLATAGHFELSGLARADSLWLLAEIFERNGLALSDPRLPRTELDPLLDQLADHPLSLELVGPHLKTLAPATIRADFAELVNQFAQKAGEQRNTSLLASLEFSKKHLSLAARSALPWLGLFQGGVFEQKLLDVSGLDPAAWEPLRAEFQAIALLRAEYDLQINMRPYLRFHPTLVAAARDRMLAEQPETRSRFVASYFVLMGALDRALHGSQSRTALLVLDLEEPNFRCAVRWAVADGSLREAAALGETLLVHLERSGRLRERVSLVGWLRRELGRGDFTEAAAQYEREHAWTRLTAGDPEGALAQLQKLIAQLRTTTEFDPSFQLALTTSMFGRVLVSTGASTQAIPILRETVGLWGKLARKKTGRGWEEILASRETTGAFSELGNLSATLGDLATALSSVGHHEEALKEAEMCVEIQTVLGAHRETAVDHGRCASILKAAGRYAEADGRFDLALAAAREAGDHEVEGSLLQHQGDLADDLGQLDRATALYREALGSFQMAGAEQGEMQTYGLLGVTELKAGRLAEARSWSEKSRELARRLKDQVSLGAAAQNLGIIEQTEGEAARAGGDEAAARGHFEQARRSVEESLLAWQSNRDKPHEAASRGQLAKIYLLLGDLDAAERYAHDARVIRESLGLLDAWRNYDTLAEIAEVRGDHAAAADWTQKRDRLLEELRRRASGDGAAGVDASGVPTLSEQMLRAMTALGIACLRAGFESQTSVELGLEEQEALAKLAVLPEPFPSFSAHLRALASRELPPIPTNLSEPLRDLLQQLHRAVT